MSTAIVLFRQDLRLSDNPALHHACTHYDKIVPLYILEEESDSPWELGGAQRWWLHYALESLNADLVERSSRLYLRRGKMLEQLFQVIEETSAQAVVWNRCYQPYAIARDTKIKSALEEREIGCQTFQGSLLNEPWKVKNQQGDYYKVFTPYWRAAKSLLDQCEPCLPVLSEYSTDGGYHCEPLSNWNLLPTQPDWAGGLRESWCVSEKGAQARLSAFLETQLAEYSNGRDFPARDKTSRLSPYLHFGLISPRQVWHYSHEAARAHGTSETALVKFLTELGWREFSYYLLYHFPKLDHANFRPEFDAFPWKDAPEHLRAWQRGQTGYPIVDAGMRELYHTGTMHNRVRMIVASFLTKDLFIHWHEGAKWFWDTLVDADLASNSASWQWVAGSGADASPYFRIFNPVLQSEKFDSDGEYLRRWVPELARLPNQYIHAPWLAPLNVLHQSGVELGINYPGPIVDHAMARAYALESYAKIKG